MEQHYYSENPSVKSEPFSFSYELRGSQFTFWSDHGVFSKKEVDFGSQLLIESFEVPGNCRTIADIGCGYGPIGLSVAKEIESAEVYMVDINQRAVELAQKNAIVNQVFNVKVMQSDLLDAIAKMRFDVVFTNPPIRTGKANIFKLYEQAFEVLNPSGELWIVIQKKQGAPSTIEKLEGMFDEVEVVNKKKGYYIIKAKKC